jgi:hypothetical protein
MWAYGSHLRVEEKDKGKENCDCIVSVEFHHDTENKLLCWIHTRNYSS